MCKTFGTKPEIVILPAEFCGFIKDPQVVFRILSHIFSLKKRQTYPMSSGWFKYYVTDQVYQYQSDVCFNDVYQSDPNLYVSFPRMPCFSLFGVKPTNHATNKCSMEGGSHQ